MADKTVTNFATMGTEAARAIDMTTGPDQHTTVVAKEGFSKSDAPDSVKGTRKGVLERNGFKGAPQVNTVYPNAPESAQVFRNVRLMPSAKGNRDFYARRAEGSPIVDQPFPGGSWTPPTKP